MESEPTALDADVSVASSTMVLVNEALVDNWTRYVEAPETAFHVSERLRGWSETPVAGEESIGAAGTGGTVVKLKTCDQAPTPPAFVALTRQ